MVLRGEVPVVFSAVTARIWPDLTSSSVMVMLANPLQPTGSQDLILMFTTLYVTSRDHYHPFGVDDQVHSSLVISVHHLGDLLAGDQFGVARPELVLAHGDPVPPLTGESRGFHYFVSGWRKNSPRVYRSPAATLSVDVSPAS